jgi:hypothetical protein
VGLIENQVIKVKEKRENKTIVRLFAHLFLFKIKWAKIDE